MAKKSKSSDADSSAALAPRAKKSKSSDDDSSEAVTPRLSFSASLVTQGEHRFYTLTVPSDVLGRTCFVSTRDADPEDGFQRLLEKKRAQEIAAYIDVGLGTIPTSIVLSAQSEADIEYSRPKKTLEFNDTNKSFLILDGQHRVYGFSLARAALRVPVVVYTGLSRRDESRIFIDINTKQRPVPNELLLDIKKLAEYESTTEETLSALFDMFTEESDSPLKGLTSPYERKTNKLSRVTFNAAAKPLLPLLMTNSTEDAYNSLAAYLAAHASCLRKVRAHESLVRPPFFKGILKFFPTVAQRVKDRHGSEYSVDNFLEVLSTAYENISTSRVKNPGQSVQAIYDVFHKALNTGFTL